MSPYLPTPPHQPLDDRGTPDLPPELQPRGTGLDESAEGLAVTRSDSLLDTARESEPDTTVACVPCGLTYSDASDDWERCPRCGEGLIELEEAGQ
jgi:hypothetical protein